MAGTVLQSVTWRASPKLHLLVSYLVEDEFSFFSVCWSNTIIFFCNPRIRVEALMHCWCCCQFLLGIAKLPIDSIRKASKLLKSSQKHIVVKIWKTITSKYNILFILIIAVAHKWCHSKTKKPRQNQKVTAKLKSHVKTKSHDKARTTATQNSHSKMKNSRQNKIATAKLKIHGKPKKPWQNKNATANQKSHGKIKKNTAN